MLEDKRKAGERVHPFPIEAPGAARKDTTNQNRWLLPGEVRKAINRNWPIGMEIKAIGTQFI
jgi:hypothetical protein